VVVVVVLLLLSSSSSLLLLVLVGELVDSCSEARGQFGNPLAEDL
jgi:hypothetical protein